MPIPETWHTISQFTGLNRKDDPTEIADTEGQIVQNFVCDDETLRVRPGISLKRTMTSGVQRMFGLARARFLGHDPSWIAVGEAEAPAYMKVINYVPPSTEFDLMPDMSYPSGFERAVFAQFQNAAILTLPYPASYPLWYRWCIDSNSTDMWHEEGDTTAKASAWTLAGASDDNTDAGVLYWNVTVSGEDVTVDLYKDSAKEAANKVATGTGVRDDTITLAEANSSGLTGSVAIAADSATDNDSGNKLTCMGIARYLDPITEPPGAPTSAVSAVTYEGFEATTGWSESHDGEFDVALKTGEAPEEDPEGSNCFEFTIANNTEWLRTVYKDFSTPVDLTGVMESQIWYQLQTTTHNSIDYVGPIYIWVQVGEKTDASSQTTGWFFEGGFRPHTHMLEGTGTGTISWYNCSDSGVLYVSLTNVDTTRTVNVYRNTAREAADLVATGSRSGDGWIQLVAQNASDLHGSVVVTYTGDDTSIEVTPIQIASIRRGHHSAVSTSMDWQAYSTKIDLIPDPFKDAIAYMTIGTQQTHPDVGHSSKFWLDWWTASSYTLLRSRSYCYTYSDSTTGRESAPSEATPDMDIAAGQSAVITIVGSDDSDVDKVRIYAKPAAAVDYRLVTEVENPAEQYQFRDSSTDWDLTESLNPDVDTPPRCSVAYSHQNRIFYAGDTDHPCRLYITDSGETARISTRAPEEEWGIAGGYWDVHPNDGGHIRALGSIGNILFVWKDHATYQLTGDSRQTFYYDDFKRQDGIVGPWAWCESEDGRLFWVSHRNVWMYDPALNKPIPIGDKLGDLIGSGGDIDHYASSASIWWGNGVTLATYDRKLFLFYWTGSAYKFLTFDLRRNHWTGPHTISDSSIQLGPVLTTALSDGTREIEFVGGNVASGTAGKLFDIWDDNDDISTAISAVWRSRKFNLHPGWYEQAVHISVTATAGEDKDITFGIYADNGDSIYHEATISCVADTEATHIVRVPHDIIGDKFYLQIQSSTTEELAIHEVGLSTRPIRRLE